MKYDKMMLAGVAFLGLKNIDQNGGISEDIREEISDLVDQITGTTLETETPPDVEAIRYCIDLIKDCIQHGEQVFTIGSKVKVLSDNPQDSGEYYDEGEEGIISLMLYDESACVVHFGGLADWNTAKIPFEHLELIKE